MKQNIDDNSGVLIIYTGGTIGSVPKDDYDPLSPLIPGEKEDIFKFLPPRYSTKDKKLVVGNDSISIEMVSLQKPIDSSNVSSETWFEIAGIIKEKYDAYEGFVILHGTDTMAYTASALSFMIDNLNKPVIITGSQLPIGSTRTDAVQNLVTSVEIAASRSLGRKVVPEVCVFFRNHLIRGCRASKLDANGFQAFTSPNMADLAHADEHIVFNEPSIRQESKQHVRFSTKFESRILTITVTPGLDPELLREIVVSEKVRGIVIRTYGTGNAPSTDGFLKAVADAVNGGKIIVNVTQCWHGKVELGLYDVSAGLLSRGVVSCMDMKDEAAYTKLGFLLAEESDISKVADKMQINLRGEQRQSVFHVHFRAGSVDDKPVTVTQSKDMVASDRYYAADIESALLRVMSVRLPNQKKGIMKAKIFIDQEEGDNKYSEKSDNYLGTIQRNWSEEEGEQNIFLNITEQAKRFIDNKHPIAISIVNETGTSLEWGTLEIAIYSKPS